jgi:hypothetical protein
MSDFLTTIASHQDLPEDMQKKMGKPIGDDMSQKHKDYLARLIGMLDRKEVIVTDPNSFLVKDVYDKLSDANRVHADLALPNIVDQVRCIEEFFRSKETPNAAPQLQTMIEHLWQMEARVEEKCGTVFTV